MALTLDELLERARAGLRRVTAEETATLLADGVTVVDIRSSDQRRRDGIVPGAIWYPRNVLEWRAAPDAPSRDPLLGDAEAPVVLMCNEGYATSLAAATLQELGFVQATDLDGGFVAWRDAGLPVRPYEPGRDDLQGSEDAPRRQS